MAERTSGRKHWDDFWKRDRDLDDIYDNDGRIPEELLGRMDIRDAVTMEVGAATARDSVILAEYGAVSIALDYSHEALRLARKAAQRAGVQILLVCGDALALPFRDASIDLVFHQGVLEHFRDPLPLLRENVRVLKEDGKVLVDVPQTLHIYTLIKKALIAMNVWFAGWETQFTAGQLAELLRETGLEPECTYGRFFSPSLAYRILRELLMKLGIRMPLKPVLLPPVHRLRRNLRRRIEASFLGPRLGYIVGIIAGKRRDT
ncbi:MAG: methyltransferase domain-containing protein [Candidatus Aegiribacteria sp.]|nr:methyltransferase domain-containing protein [Candidatus Aegiribacteria sp.]